MSELRGKNLLMEDLFHAHWSKNHRQKKYWSRAHLQTEKTTFEKRAATTKDPHPSSKTNRLAQLFGHKSERTHTKTRLSLCTFVVFLLESLCQVLLDIFALAFLLLRSSRCNEPFYLHHSLWNSSVIDIWFAADVTTQFSRRIFL